MPDYKKQHFVPRFYFKLFSLDKKMINQFNLDHKIFNLVQIKNVCQKKYFYGKNIEIEKSLSIFEKEHAKIIHNILNLEELPKKETPEYFELLRYTCLQSHRTNKAKKAVEKRVDLFSEEVIKPMMLFDEELQKKGIDRNFLDSIRITYPSLFPYQLINALESPILLFDLEPILILNSTKIDFVFSDSPVILYNQYYWKEKSGHKGLQSSGLLIFLPLNSKTLLLLYDKKFYSIKSKGRLKLSENKDIIVLNVLQFFNSFRNIYFSDKKHEALIRSIFDKIEKYVNKTRKQLIDRNWFIQKTQANTRSEILHLSTPNIRYKLNTSFIKIRNDIMETYIRNEALVTLYKQRMDSYREMFDKGTL